MESADEYQTIKLNKKPKMVIPIHESDKVQLLDTTQNLGFTSQIEINVPDIGREIVTEPSDLSVRDRFEIVYFVAKN